MYPNAGPAVAAPEALDRPDRLTTLTLSLLRVGRGAAVLAMGVGLAVLIGYAARVGRIVQLRPSLPPMYPNTAIALLCAGASSLAASGVGRARRSVGVTLGSVVLGIGAAGSFLHLIGAPVGWFEVLWPADPFVEATTPTPGRPAVETCASLVLIGTALVLLCRQRAPRLAQALSLGSMTIGLTALIGYLVGVDRADLGSSFVVGMALHTAIGLTAVSFSALVARPGVGGVALLTEAGPTGRSARLLTVGALAVPVALALAQVLLTRLFDQSRLAGSIITVLQVGLLGALVVVPLAVLERSDRLQLVTADTHRRDGESRRDVDLIVDAVARDVTEPPPELAGWTVAVRLEAAHGHLAGDSQQVLQRDDGHVLLAVIDVAGHGTAAGIIAFRLRCEVEALWRNDLPIERIADTLNASAIGHDTIATCFLGDLDPRSGALTYLNAGHPAGLHVHIASMEALTTTRPLLGLPTNQGTAVRTLLRRGDLLVLHTDGVTEARDDLGEQFGDERLSRIVRARSPEGPAVLAQACIDAALHHTGNRLRDDALILALERN